MGGVGKGMCVCVKDRCGGAAVKVADPVVTIRHINPALCLAGSNTKPG